MVTQSKTDDIEAKSFGFRLKFHLPSGRTFQGLRHRKRIFSDISDVRIYLNKLKQQRRNKFGARLRYAFNGTGFSTEEEAKTFGQKLRVALRMFATERQIGIDTGKDQGASFSNEIKARIAEQFGVQLRDDIHGLDVFDESPPVTRLSIEAFGQTSQVIIGIDKGIRAFFDKNITLNAKEELAVDLYNLSHFEGSIKTRFLTLITVVEILSTRDVRSESIVRYVDGLMDNLKASNLPAAEILVLENGLRNLKIQSIGEACKEFVSKHSTVEDAAFFKKCYDARSNLVHTGTTRKAEALDPSTLDALVSKLLLKSLT